jgi:hypothetical protein
MPVLAVPNLPWRSQVRILRGAPPAFWVPQQALFSGAGEMNVRFSLIGQCARTSAVSQLGNFQCQHEN